MSQPAMDQRLSLDQLLLMEAFAFNQRSLENKPLTIAEFEALPENQYGWKEELVRGHVVREPPPSPYHGGVIARMAALLDNYNRESRRGFVFTYGAVEIEADPLPTVRGPDLAFVLRERLPDGELPKRLPFAPDIAVEVVSPSNSAADILEKVAEYLSRGSRQVWIVYPRTRQIMVHYPTNEARLLTADQELDGGDVLPGFTVPAASLFDL